MRAEGNMSLYVLFQKTSAPAHVSASEMLRTHQQCAIREAWSANVPVLHVYVQQGSGKAAQASSPVTWQHEVNAYIFFFILTEYNRL